MSDEGSSRLTARATAEWQRRVREILARRGRGSQKRLAEETGISMPDLSKILSAEAEGRESHMVPVISAALGVALPSTDLDEEDEASFLAFRELRPDLYDELRELVRSWTHLARQQRVLEEDMQDHLRKIAEKLLTKHKDR